MGPYITAVKASVSAIVRKTASRYNGAELRLAFVRYTDYDQGSNRFSTFAFSKDGNAFEAFVGSLAAGGGGDECEDIFGGLNVALNNLEWGSEQTTNILVHIADASCHGTIYHGGRNDTYPNGDPANIPLATLMSGVIQKRIKYSFGYINTTTDLMIQKFNEELFRQSQNSNFSIKKFAAISDSTMLSEAVSAIASESIATTMSAAKVDPTHTIRPFEIDPSLPSDWTKVPAVEASVLHFALPTLEAITSFKGTFATNTTTVFLRVASKPFSQGGFRLAYHARAYNDSKLDESTAKHVVLKLSKRTGKRHDSYKQYCQELENSAVAAKLALDYTTILKAVSPTSSKISYSFAQVALFKMDPTNHSVLFTTPPPADAVFGAADRTTYNLELYMTGKYQKYSDNWRFIDDTDAAKEFACFSHWTYKHTNRKLMVVDLQGTATDAGIIFTDPAIHSVYSHRFAATNLGKRGMDGFFRAHKCSELCQKLGISDFRP